MRICIFPLLLFLLSASSIVLSFFKGRFNVVVRQVDLVVAESMRLFFCIPRVVVRCKGET